MTPVDIIFIVASGISILIAYIVKNKATYIAFQTLCNVILMINYIYLQLYSSAIVVAVATVRFVVFYLLVKKYNNISWWVIIPFASVAALLGILTLNQPIDYLFIVAVVLYSCGYKVRDLIKLKMALFIPLAMMLVYAILTKAYSGMIMHAFELSMMLTQIVAHFIRTSKTKKQVGY